MRVLYDISVLGLACLYQQSRGGSYRADLHLTEALVASPECELLFCANHSTVAYYGCEAFLRGHPRLGAVPLVAPRSGVRSSLGAAATRVHRRVRRLVGSNVLPSALRHTAAFIDRRLHPPVADCAVDVLHSPSMPLPPRPRRGSAKRFLTIYDVAYLRFPEIYGAAYRRSATAAIRSLVPGDHVITTSQFVRDELLERRVAAPDRIHVVPLAAHPAMFYRCHDREKIATVRRRYGIPEGPYVLSVNSPDPRKNVPHAIHAFARAVRDARDRLTSLVLTGNHGPGTDRIQQAIVEHPALAGRVVVTGYIADDDLAALYSDARVFVYPSIYEGFGLPPLEAMQCGTPVITADTSSLPEVVGDGGVRVPPADLDALAGAIVDLAGDSARRAALQQRALAQARRFSWERSAAETLRAYRAALEA
jgi:glycosyltransferase involved in cell wall biosynthesis